MRQQLGYKTPEFLAGIRHAEEIKKTNSASGSEFNPYRLELCKNTF